MTHPELNTVTETFRFPGLTLRIERVTNLDDLVDQVTDEAFSHDERLPYWAELWPASIGLCRYLRRHEETVRGKRVLELGCGLGLTSICLYYAEPSALLVTDYEMPALEMMVRNFRLNGLPPPAHRLMDWRSPGESRHFERIVASDVLYEKRFFTVLLDLFDRVLEPGGYALIAEPNRPIAKDFFELAVNRGYFFECDRETVHQYGHDIVVNICYFKKRIK